MKKTCFSLFLLILAFSSHAFLTDAGSKEVAGDTTSNPGQFLSCYHKVNGVLRPSPYALIPASAQCPPCSQNSNCMADDDYVKTVLGLPEHLCEEEAIGDWN